jgi:hypothetical protein
VSSKARNSKARNCWEVAIEFMGRADNSGCQSRRREVESRLPQEEL